VNHGTDRSRRREQFDFDKPLPLGELGQKCINGELSFEAAVDAFSFLVIDAALKKHKDNRAATARYLGVNRTTLQMMTASFAKAHEPVKAPKRSAPLNLSEDSVLHESVSLVSPAANCEEFYRRFRDILQSLSATHQNAQASPE
jgi:hypothetical protein